MKTCTPNLNDMVASHAESVLPCVLLRGDFILEVAWPVPSGAMVCNGCTRDLVSLATMGWLHAWFVQHGNQSCFRFKHNSFMLPHGSYVYGWSCDDTRLCVWKVPQIYQQNKFFPYGSIINCSNELWLRNSHRAESFLTNSLVEETNFIKARNKFLQQK